MKTDITKVIEEINSDHKMTDERMNKVMTAIINCGDGYEGSVDYLYKKEVDGVEFFVNKLHIGKYRFALHFVVIDNNTDDCENDVDDELWVESMGDLASAVEAIARFDDDPMGFINTLVFQNSIGTIRSEICKIKDRLVCMDAESEEYDILIKELCELQIELNYIIYDTKE